MSRYLLSIIALFALLVAPIGMIGGTAMAMPHHQPQAAAVHCAGAPAPDHRGDEDRTAIDCMIACAGVPAIPPSAPSAVAPAAVSPDEAPLRSLHGLQPEAATPPPRFS
ncbi:hypothetical protein [Sphingosinicella sp. CPCC 101087]|uniref:hypothetical protein n=1 Tax=Sphingosinicella sp. CPCC 101087 TaxID=2497754 RepID=UPI00101BFC6B|nr:hypothetical protein [Sphingosinicella sp. CPCC 101087]